MKVISNLSGYAVDAFQIEADFDEGRHADAWSQFRDHWTDSVRHAGLYLLLVFAGKRYMEARPRFELRTPLTVWSSFLAVFSICGAIRTLPELVYILSRYGLDRSFCDSSFMYSPTGLWAYLFTISKLYELVDTAFIVLRKQKLVVLHWYHHATVLVYVWYSYSERASTGRWFMVMNYVIHSLMYSYYALRAMRFRIPTYVNIVITVGQIIQMAMGIVVNVRASVIKAGGGHCQVSDNNLVASLIMYATYLLLFTHFFYVAYIAKKPRVDAQTDVTKAEAKAGKQF